MWARLLYRIRDYFGFTYAEATGFAGLIALFAWCVLSPWWLELFTPEATSATPSQEQLDSLVAQLELKAGKQPKRYPTNDKKAPLASSELFAFDPNTLEEEGWKRLGLRPYIASNILKYRAKGGQFRIKRDLLKIYHFPPELFAQLESYILLPDTLSRHATSATRAKYEPTLGVANPPLPRSFDLNTADTTQLKAIRGIGSKLSQRIIKYRDKLGGFVRNEQVKEVFGLDSAVVAEVVKKSAVQPGFQPRKIRINSATEAELRQHPYIFPRLASLMVAYRQQHGPFHDAQSLAPIKLLDAATLQKLTPYLEFDQ